MARVAGPLPGIFTLVLDGVKGAAAVWLAARFANESAAWMTIAGLAALIGHCFPVWLSFRGGKGVATAAGMFLAAVLARGAGRDQRLYPCRCVFSRYRVAGFDAAAAAMPLLIYFLWAPHHAPPLVVTFGAFAAAMLVVYKHDAQHSATRRRPRAQILVRQEQGRRVTQIAILGAGKLGHGVGDRPVAQPARA